VNDPTLFNLPNLQSNETNVHPKILNVHNSSYVDGFFLFLSSNLIHQYNFAHGVDYYGSFLAIKKNFTVNIFDDIDYLQTSEFFRKNKNILFTTDDYEHLFEQNVKDSIKPIKIEYNSTIKSNISAKSFDDTLFEDIFETNVHDLMNDNVMVNVNVMENVNVVENASELLDITHMNIQEKEKDNHFTLKTNSSCSSRSSYTTNENDEDHEDGKDNEDENDENDENDDDETVWEEEDEEEESIEEETINAVIPIFPVEVIFMEPCENTFDDLILTNELTEEEWFSAFMQIIMILITYQKTFSFTHNDLHTNNVMYNSTEKKYLYYQYNKKYYKVPTFGRIFKIIDFGRGIYKFNGNIFCSDSFQAGGDASTQYNIEPFFNDKKPLLEPNFSFDICRLACSIFDHIIDDISEVKDMNALDPVRKIIVEWCLDDKGINLLYKNNGADRYPEFKLYKMIARCVHNHTPQLQLDRPEFKKYLHVNNNNQISLNELINIDNMPIYT